MYIKLCTLIIKDLIYHRWNNSILFFLAIYSKYQNNLRFKSINKLKYINNNKYIKKFVWDDFSYIFNLFV